MKYKTDIGLIYSHSECIRCDHNLCPVINEIFLTFISCLCPHSCVISSDRESGILQFQIEFIYIFSCRTINNSTVFSVLCKIFLNRFLLPTCRSYFKIKIFSVKTGYIYIRRFKIKYFKNIFSYFLCCCCCKCTDDRASWKLADEFCDLHITWAEILSPLGNTVSLIDCHHRKFCMTCKVQKPWCQQTFRRNINHLISACRCQF